MRVPGSRVDGVAVAVQATDEGVLVSKDKKRVIQIVLFQGLPFIEIDYPEDLKKARDEIAPRLASLYPERTS